MKIAGISSVRRRAYKATTNSNHSHPIAPNLLMRNFSFARPDDMFAYLEAFYNTVRPYSALGWLSPAYFEETLYASAT